MDPPRSTFSPYADKWGPYALVGRPCDGQLAGSILCVAHLSEWVKRARGGDEDVITDRGVPVARLLGLWPT
jgi:hypothetical protein